MTDQVSPKCDVCGAPYTRLIIQSGVTIPVCGRDDCATKARGYLDLSAKYERLNNRAVPATTAGDRDNGN